MLPPESGEFTRISFRNLSLRLIVCMSSGFRLCRIRQCSAVIPPREEYHFRICPACRSSTGERLREWRQRMKGANSTDNGMPSSAPNSTPGFTSATLTQKQQQSMKGPIFPSYQSSDFMLREFGRRLTGFLQAHVAYLQMKLLDIQSQPSSQQLDASGMTQISIGPAFFVFEGEFSEVADPKGGDMTTAIHHMSRAVMGVVGVPYMYVVPLCVFLCRFERRANLFGFAVGMTGCFQPQTGWS